MTATVRIEIALDVPPGVWPVTSRGFDAEVRSIGLTVYGDQPGRPGWDFPKVAYRTHGGDWSKGLRTAYSIDWATMPASVRKMAADAYRAAVAGIAPELGEDR